MTPHGLKKARMSPKRIQMCQQLQTAPAQEPYRRSGEEEQDRQSCETQARAGRSPFPQPERYRNAACERRAEDRVAERIDADISCGADVGGLQSSRHDEAERDRVGHADGREESAEPELRSVFGRLSARALLCLAVEGFCGRKLGARNFAGRLCNGVLSCANCPARGVGAVCDLTCRSATGLCSLAGSVSYVVLGKSCFQLRRLLTQRRDQLVAAFMPRELECSSDAAVDLRQAGSQALAFVQIHLPPQSGGGRGASTPRAAGSAPARPGGARPLPSRRRPYRRWQSSNPNPWSRVPIPT